MNRAELAADLALTMRNLTAIDRRNVFGPNTEKKPPSITENMPAGTAAWLQWDLGTEQGERSSFGGDETHDGDIEVEVFVPATEGVHGLEAIAIDVLATLKASSKSGLAFWRSRVGARLSTSQGWYGRRYLIGYTRTQGA